MSPIQRSLRLDYQPLKLRTRSFRDNFGTFEKWELSGFRGVSDTNEAI